MHINRIKHVRNIQHQCINGLKHSLIYKRYILRGGEYLAQKEYLTDSLSKSQIKKINDSKKHLMSLIDQDNSIEVEKVERYANLLRLFYALDRAIDELGPMSHIKNGSQEYIKQNPAIAEKNRVNGALLALEKSFNLEKRAERKRQEEAAKGPDLT